MGEMFKKREFKGLDKKRVNKYKTSASISNFQKRNPSVASNFQNQIF